jgi:EAL domain-containing protein (putative c-di-GMP-specific phosphodiesterase class I)
MNAKALQRLALESSLRRAISRDELTVYYQPQLATGSWRIIAAEALVRWRHPEFGFLLPSEFIPLAEETGLIVGIGQWVLRTACTQLRKWHMEGFRDLGIAVNISAREFHTGDPADAIIRTLDDVGLDPRHLTLELTESWLMADVEPVVRSLTRLGESGVTLSIDDFGTGFCSFEYLRRMPLHILKIDETFVRNAATNADDAAMVAALISLAHRLRLKVIAEGLENQDQVELLKRLDCDAMQGFMFAKPMPANQFERLLVRTAAKPKDILSRVWPIPRSEISPRTWKAALSSGTV